MAEISDPLCRKCGLSQDYVQHCRECGAREMKNPAKKPIECCEALRDAERAEGIYADGEKWKIAWDSAYTGYEPIGVRFCPYCGDKLPGVLE